MLKLEEGELGNGMFDHNTYFLIQKQCQDVMIRNHDL